MRLTFIFIVAVFLLSSCSGEVYDRAYTASGDGNQESELRQDEQFTTTDDFNVVIKLNNHEENVKVMARFTDPNGDVLQEISTDADSNIGTVILGVDYEARSDAGDTWLTGRYKVDIFIEDDRVDTLFFRVD